MSRDIRKERFFHQQQVNDFYSDRNITRGKNLTSNMQNLNFIQRKLVVIHLGK